MKILTFSFISEYGLLEKFGMVFEPKGWGKKIQDADSQLFKISRVEKLVSKGGLNVKVKSLYVEPYTIFKKLKGKSVVNEKAMEVLRKYTLLRDLVTDLLQAENAGNNEKSDDFRKKLNGFYDEFVKEHGFLNNTHNKRIYEDDPLVYRVLVLEDYDKGISAAVAKSTGADTRPESAKKSRVFFENVLKPFELQDMSDASFEDILKYSSAVKGKIDIDFMSEVSGKSGKELSKNVIESGKGFLAYDDNYDFLEREIFLSGDIGVKIEQTKDYILGQGAEISDEYGNTFNLTGNIKALEDVLPKPIKIHELEPTLGESWIPTDIIGRFINEKIYENKAITVENISSLGKWVIGTTSHIPDNFTDFCTKRVKALTLIENILNHKAVVVKDRTGENQYVVNEEETTLAQEKINSIKNEFESFILENSELISGLESTYKDHCITPKTIIKI